MPPRRTKSLFPLAAATVVQLVVAAAIVGAEAQTATAVTPSVAAPTTVVAAAAATTAGLVSRRTDDAAPLPTTIATTQRENTRRAVILPLASDVSSTRLDKQAVPQARREKGVYHTTLKHTFLPSLKQNFFLFCFVSFHLPRRQRLEKN